MLRIREAILVEGRYDKNTLSQVVDTLILETGGFGVFKKPELLTLLRRIAAERGLIVLTDSDGAGFVIRGHIKGGIDPAWVKHAYIPDIMGKERRKSVGSREGTLGVEGMSPAVLEQALRRAGATFLDEDSPAISPRVPVTKGDLVEWGLSGSPNAAALRQALLKRLELPRHLTANALLAVVNTLYDRDEVEQLVDDVRREAADI